MSRSRRSFSVVLLATLLAMLLAAGCGPLERPAENREFSMDADDFFFEPETLEVSAGDTVVIQMRNIGVTPHNFVIDDVVVSDTIDPGQTTTFDFQAPEAGTYEFYCGVPGHRELGMVGTLEVRE